MHLYTSTGGQIANDRQDKATPSLRSFRQAGTKGKSIKEGQFARLLRAKKIGYITRATVAKGIIERGRMF